METNPQLAGVGGSLYYRHSGRFSSGGVVLALLAGLGAGILIGPVYAYVDLYDPLVYFAFLVTGGTGFAMGIILSRMFKRGKVRNAGVAAVVTLVAALVMYLVIWEVWLFAFLQRAGVPVSLFDVLSEPRVAWAIIGEINRKGAWTISGDAPTGISLAGVWLVEAGLLLGIPVWLVVTAINEHPFCEQCQKWCTSRTIANLNPGDAAGIKGRLESRDYAVLAPLGLSKDSARSWWRVYFQGCGDCDTTQTLCVDAVTLTVDRRGRSKTQTRHLVRRLLLTPEDVVAVATVVATATKPVVPAAEEKPEAAG